LYLSIIQTSLSEKNIIESFIHLESLFQRSSNLPMDYRYRSR
jgi:hypothetical protein